MDKFVNDVKKCIRNDSFPTYHHVQVHKNEIEMIFYYWPVASFANMV